MLRLKPEFVKKMKNMVGKKSIKVDDFARRYGLKIDDSKECLS